MKTKANRKLLISLNIRSFQLRCQRSSRVGRLFFAAFLCFNSLSGLFSFLFRAPNASLSLFRFSPTFVLYFRRRQQIRPRDAIRLRPSDGQGKARVATVRAGRIGRKNL